MQVTKLAKSKLPTKEPLTGTTVPSTGQKKYLVRYFGPKLVLTD